ncbi:MAG: ATP-dependent DNA helicase, partial [Candidatus Obscuribacterales bacterium]|nr:ATP-dependent DNA helicase [Steroidobacteraceae bacterium]
ARVIKGFATRPEQVSMAQAVASALAMRRHSLIEAGTGVGKTFAYLVPALFAHRRVIVSTGTRTLQDQLFHRDLPVIARAMGLPVRVAMLKGRSNYLCLQRLELAEREVATNARSRSAMRLLNTIRRWSHTTVSGDIGELAEQNEQEPLWQAVTSTRENCLGGECPVFQRCHVVAARREAQAADVIVVNHHLLMADLLLKEQGFGDLLPGVDAVVIDEAHQLPDIAAQFLGVSVNTRHIQHLCRDLTVELLAQRIDDEELRATLHAIESAAAESQTALLDKGERLELEQWPTLFVESLHELLTCARGLAERLQSLGVEEASLRQIQTRAADLADRLSLLLATNVEESRGVRWVQRAQNGFVVQFSPINVATQLSRLIEEHAAAWIFTSATLAVGNDFTHFARRVGMSAAQGLQFGSPFDYAEQALLYLPRGLDSPSSPHHTRQVIDAALPVLKASGGRAFLLFTSHRALKAGAALFRDYLQGDSPFPVLVQGEAPREQLLQRFREAGNAVLFGTSSFWEGVDVKGTALAVVIIDKLPFAAPDDPVLKARAKAVEQRGGNAFFEEQVPEAVIALKQGVGRLIRDSEDFGVVMLCDTRVSSRGYGRIFLDSLPPMPRTDSLKRVTTFLLQRLGAVGITIEEEVS